MIGDVKRRWPADVFDIDSDIKISGDGTDDKPIGVREIEMERGLIVRDLWAAVLPDDESPSSRRQWLVPGKYSTHENTSCQVSLSVPREAEALQPLSLF